MRAVVIGLASLGTDGIGARGADEPLERIAVREGRFVGAVSGKPFTPLGVNYYRLAKDPKRQDHAAFCPGVYDAAYVQHMMADVAQSGWNTVRVFHSHLVGPSGLIESPESTVIHPAYLANVIHCLRTARDHGVRVIFTWDIWLPLAKAWAEQPLQENWETVFESRSKPRQGVNASRLSLASVRTRAAGIVTLIRAIHAVDPTLLAVVLAWELENEVRFAADSEPFVSRPQAFAFASRQFDVSTDSGSQALMDAATVAWASACADAIHGADAEALVSASVFTFHAVGRRQPGNLWHDATRDMRIPSSPRALLTSRIDFIDIHVYAHRGPLERLKSDVAATLESVGFAEVVGESRRLGKPILAGEVGVSVGTTRRAPAWHEIRHDVGMEMLDHLVTLVRDAGFAGALLWHYGNPESQTDDEFPAVELHPEYGERLRAAWNRGQRSVPTTAP